MIIQQEVFDLLWRHGIKVDLADQFDIWRDFENTFQISENYLQEKYDEGFSDGEDSRDGQFEDLEKERDDYIEQNNELLEENKDLKEQLEKLQINPTSNG